MKTVSVISLKGGCGKSSLVLLLAALYADRGKRVLVIDGDPQNSTTAFLAGDGLTGNLARAIMDEDITANITPIRPGLDLVGSSLGLLNIRTVNPRVLSRILPKVADRYDLTLIDCAPTLDAVVLNAAHAADLILTPSRACGFDLKTAVFLRDQLAAEGAGPWFVVPNFYREPRGDGLAAQLDAAYRDTLGAALLPIRIPHTVDIPKALNFRESITPGRRYFAALAELADWIEGDTWRGN